MSLLDATYFDRVDCSIPQGTYNTIAEHITRYERDILIGVLGYELYALVAAYANPGSDQRIIDLVEGKLYDYGDYQVKWNGLLNSEKVSPLAYAVFAEWLKNTITTMNVGAVAHSTESGSTFPTAQVIQAATVKARELFGFAGQDALIGSLYNFLAAHEDDYPEWIWSEYRIMNMFGI